MRQFNRLHILRPKALAGPNRRNIIGIGRDPQFCQGVGTAKPKYEPGRPFGVMPAPKLAPYRVPDVAKVQANFVRRPNPKRYAPSDTLRRSLKHPKEIPRDPAIFRAPGYQSIRMRLEVTFDVMRGQGWVFKALDEGGDPTRCRSDKLKITIDQRQRV